LNAPSLRAYQQSQACGLGTAVTPNCRLLVQGTILDDRPLPLGIHALTLSTDRGRAVYYGRAEADRSSDAGAAASDALLIVWGGRSGHAAVAVPLHALCGLAAVGMLAANGWGSGRSLVAVARRGLEGLSDEPALRLGSDVALAGVLVALCASLTADLVVNDLL